MNNSSANFQHLYNVHLNREELNCTSLLVRNLDQIQALHVAISLNAQRLKSFMQVIWICSVFKPIFVGVVGLGLNT